MGDNFIPDDIGQFILAKIDSVAQLEALLLVRNNPEEEWSVESLAKRLYISEEQTTEVLVRLCTEGFLITKAGKPRLYEYQPASNELRDMVDRIADIYSKHLVPITNLIHSKPKTRVQEFAEAFRLRKDE